MISVCVATHNGEKYILEQLNSILSQISATDEVIISDDGSTDSTLQLITSLSDHRIKVFHYNQKISYQKKKYPSYYYASANFHNALLSASGDFIFLSDQDDIWELDKVKIVMSYLLRYDIICSNFSVINESGIFLQDRFFYEKMFESSSFIDMIRYLPFRGCCLAFNKSVLKNSLPFPKYLFLHDCWIGLNALFSGYKYFYIDDPLIQYRRHTENVSSLSSPNNIFFKIYYRAVLILQILLFKFSRKFL